MSTVLLQPGRVFIAPIGSDQWEEVGSHGTLSITSDDVADESTDVPMLGFEFAPIVVKLNELDMRSLKALFGLTDGSLRRMHATYRLRQLARRRRS